MSIKLIPIVLFLVFLTTGCHSYTEKETRIGFTTDDMSQIIHLDLNQVENLILQFIEDNEPCSPSKDSLYGNWGFGTTYPERRYRETFSEAVSDPDPDANVVTYNPEHIAKGKWGVFLKNRDKGWVSAYSVFIGECDGRITEYDISIVISIGERYEIVERKIGELPLY